jgi:translocation protein SEC62
MSMPPPPPGQGMPMPMRPGQQPTPEQIQAMRRQLEADAEKAGMTVPQFVEQLKQQAQAQRMAAMQRAQAQGQGGPPQGQMRPMPPQGQQGRPPPGAQPVVPGPPNPKALALANFLRGQELKPRTCILNGERKDMFRGTASPQTLWCNTIC